MDPLFGFTKALTGLAGWLSDMVMA
jgi:hypothetical protein